MKQSIVTLLQSGFSVEDLGPKEIGVIADHLEAGFKQEGGIIGFGKLQCCNTSFRVK